jgi:hypothetical protein
MKFQTVFIYVAFSLCSYIPILAQSQRIIPTCSETPETKIVLGNTLKLLVPKDAIINKDTLDVDYWWYSVGFGPEKNRVWLRGIYGLHATSGQVPQKWLSSSTKIARRTWKHGKYRGVDAKGKLRNGNYWRYFGQFNESIEYYDVSAEAAAYFDNIIDNVCFLELR